MGRFGDARHPFQLAIEASPNGVLLVEAGGTIVLVNRELERQFGYARDELLGRSVDELLPETVRAIHAAHREGFAHAPAARPMAGGRELYGRRKDGSRVQIQIGLNPIHSAEGPLVLASVVEMTARRQSGEEQRRALGGQLTFGRLLADLSARLINSPSNEIDNAIRDALGRICEAFDLDRSVFFRMRADGALSDAVSWAAAGIPPPFSAPLPSEERLHWAIEGLLAGRVVAFSRLEDVPNEIDRAAHGAAGTKSALVVPLMVAGGVAGAVGFDTVRAERPWSPGMVHQLEVMASVFGQVVARRQADEALRAALTEVERTSDDLQVENVHLRREVVQRLKHGRAPVVGRSAALRRVLEQVRQAAATDATVLLLGETGTGKESFATQIHEGSARRGRTMVRVNCAAIPAALIDGELFGREKGAFTGSLARQVGRFELADGSTIFLDEIGHLPSEVQVKLLRLLEERHIVRLGSPRPITVNTRIVAATHRNLEQRIAQGAFREDLYDRLNVFRIAVPPLRERVEDIPLLVWRFVDEFSRSFGRRIESIGTDSLAALQRYEWPGNIRELRNVVERAMIAASGPRLTIAIPLAPEVERSPKLVDVEKAHILTVLEATGWRIRGTGGAADRLGLKPTTLETRMAKLGLKRPAHA